MLMPGEFRNGGTAKAADLVVRRRWDRYAFGCGASGPVGAFVEIVDSEARRSSMSCFNVASMLYVLAHQFELEGGRFW